VNEQEALRDLRGKLNSAQLELLRWVAGGCRDGVYEGYSQRISAAALQTRRLLRITGHGSSWRAELTPRGAALLELPEPTPPSQAESRSISKANSSEPAESRPTRTLSKTEQLIADLIAAGGVLRVPYWRREGEPDYRQRAIAAQRFGKVPPDKRLVMEHVRGGELEIRIEEALPGTDIVAQAVPVPARLSRPHPVAARYRDDTDHHQVSRATLARSVRIVHALAAEAERRGHQVPNPNHPARERSARDSAKEAVPHLVITVGNHAYSLNVSEEKVLVRGVWEERKRAQEQYRLQYPLDGSHERLKPYDSEATGQLSISLLASGVSTRRPGGDVERSQVVAPRGKALRAAPRARATRRRGRSSRGRGEAQGGGTAASMGSADGTRPAALPRSPSRQSLPRADRRATGSPGHVVLSRRTRSGARG
jgi:hypothetical protein